MINLLEVNGVRESDMRDLCAELMIPFSSEVRTTAPVVFRLATAPVALATEGEKLTEEERDVLTHGGAGPQTCAKVLRIIDEQCAALTRTNRAADVLNSQWGALTAALARVRAANEKAKYQYKGGGVSAAPLIASIDEALAGSPAAPEATYEQHVESLEADLAAKKLTAANARIVGLERATAHVGNLQRALAAANARAEAAEREAELNATETEHALDAARRHESESAALRSEIDHEKRLTAEQYATIRAQQTQAEQYQSEAAALRAELTQANLNTSAACGELNMALHASEHWSQEAAHHRDEAAALRAEVDQWVGLYQRTESRLAAVQDAAATANALIAEWLAPEGHAGRTKLEMRSYAHLAAQPATWCPKCKSVRPCPGCTIPAAQPATAVWPAPDGSLLMPVQRWDSAQPAPLATPVDWAAAEPAVSAGEHARDARRDGAGSK